MGNCTSFPKGMVLGDDAAAPPPEQPTEEFEGGEVKNELEVEKNVIEAKEDDKLVDDKHSQEGEKKPDSTTKSLEEYESFASAISSGPDQGKYHLTTVAHELSEVAPSTSTTEKPDQEVKTVAETPVAEVSKEESK